MTTSIRLAVLLALGVALPAAGATDPAKPKAAKAEATRVEATEATQAEATKASSAAAQGRFTFLDVNGDGVLSQYEYDSDVAFEMMDSDHDASLSVAELQALLGPVQEGVPTAADRILIADLDGNGALDDGELRRATEMRFGWLDRNQDGNLDLAELQSGFGVRVRPGD